MKFLFDENVLTEARVVQSVKFCIKNVIDFSLIKFASKIVKIRNFNPKKN